MLAKRSIVEIVHEVLQLNGRKKTDIMYRTALTYPQTMRYLNALVERGLMSKAKDPKGRDIFQITQKGRELSEHLGIVMEYLGLGENDA